MGEHYTPSTVAQYSELQAWKCYFAATYTLLVWDWITTLDIEVERIWRRKRTSFTVLWALIRYAPIIMYASATYATFQTTWEPEMCVPRACSSRSNFASHPCTCRCTTFATLPTVFVIVVLLIAHVIFLLRTYALYRRSRVILSVFIPALFIEAGVLIWTAFDEQLTTLPEGFGCIPGSPGRVQGIVTWTAPFIYDCMIFGFTLSQSLKYFRESQEVPIVHVILRDGLVYFALMFVSYSLNIFMYIFAPPGLHDINAGFSTTITVISTCRLILNLRAATPGHQTGDELPSRSHMSFLSKPSDMISTFLTEIGGGHEGQTALRHQRQEFQLEDIDHRPRRGRGSYIFA